MTSKVHYMLYNREVDLETGFEILSHPKESRLLQGKRVSACSGWDLFSSLRGKPIQCYACSREAHRWIADSPRFDKENKLSVLNLYGGHTNHEIMLMTRDHIIPKSLGGVDAVENLRPACGDCNSSRGNQQTEADREFRLAHPHLISEARLRKGIEGVMRGITQNTSEKEKRRILAPFEFHSLI